MQGSGVSEMTNVDLFGFVVCRLASLCVDCARVMSIYICSVPLRSGVMHLYSASYGCEDTSNLLAHTKCKKNKLPSCMKVICDHTII